MSNPVYRAVVSYSNETTGEILVQIPALTGYDSIVSVSKIARTAYNGTWVVPPIGSQIVVTADDPNLTNLFWVQVAPSGDTNVTSLVDDLLALTNRVAILEAFKKNSEVIDLFSSLG